MPTTYKPQGSAAQGSTASSAPLALWLKESYSGKYRDEFFEKTLRVLATWYSHLEEHKYTMLLEEGGTNVMAATSRGSAR
jgi:hypothetical protein